MKLTETTLTLALIAFGTASFAFPAHQQDGFRDTGCDEAARVEIRNDAGELIYVNNPTCRSTGGGNGLGLATAAVIDAIRDARQEEEPIDCKECEIATK